MYWTYRWFQGVCLQNLMACHTLIFVTHDLEEAVLLADRVIVITARPGRIKSDTVIDLPRPRVIDELRFDETFKEAEHRIWRELRDEIV